MSSSDIALRVEGLGKRYRIGVQETGGGYYRYKSLRDAFGGIARRPLKTVRDAVIREPMNEENSFWALKDINFEVKKGEVVGIIGRNGAGKSTLLKILSQITKPTTGQVDLFGRVGSLLEVGTGFHPELSGRENIYLHGAILGMTHTEIAKQFDSIIDFAGIGRFIDTSVKHYSSGMYVRLAFAVAAHLDPEILVVDEVLAVGDLEFQRKCLAKMKDVSLGGRTVLLVSHNMHSIAQLCPRVAWFESGRLMAIGPVNDLVPRYISGDATEPAKGERAWEPDEAPGNERFRLLAVRMLSRKGEPACSAVFSERFSLEITYLVKDWVRDLRVYFIIADLSGQYILSSDDVDSTPECFAPREIGIYRSRGEVWANLLKPGEYNFHVGAVDHCREYLCMAEGVLRFQISTGGETFVRDWHTRPGTVTPKFNWTIEKLAP